MSQELKLQSPMDAIHEFAKTLTSKVRELDELERTWKIGTNQATAILEQMIEAQIYAIFKTMHHSARYSTEDREAAAEAMKVFLDKDGIFTPHNIKEESSLTKEAES